MPEVLEGEVISSVVEPAPQSPRDKALGEFQAVFGAEHGTQLADFFVVHYALIDAFRRATNLAAQPGLPDQIRTALAVRNASEFGKVLTDVVVAAVVLRDSLGITPSEADFAKVDAVLKLAREHHTAFNAIEQQYDETGKPVTAANASTADTLVVETPGRIIVPAN